MSLFKGMVHLARKLSTCGVNLRKGCRTNEKHSTRQKRMLSL